MTDDQDILNKIKCGDESAFLSIYLRYWDPLYLFLLKRLGNEEEACDLVQEVFLTLWDKREILDIHTSLRSYLFKMAYHRALNVLSRSQYRERYEQSLENYLRTAYIAPPDMGLMEKDLNRIIDVEVEKFSVQMKKVFQLSRYEQLSHQEIAELLAISKDTVRAHIRRALRLLRMKMGIILLVFAFL